MSKRYQDNFEHVYLRLHYMEHIKHYDTESVKQNEHIIKITANKMFNKYFTNFNRMNFTQDDIISITRVYAFIYFGLYSFKNNPDKLQKFKEKYLKNHKVYPTTEFLDKTERNNLIRFLRQLLLYCSISCEKKSRNIRCGKEIRKQFIKTKDSKKVDDEILLDNHEKYGYKKITKKQLKEMQKNDDMSQVVQVSSLYNDMDYISYKILFVKSNTPEEIIINNETEIELEQYKNKFNNLTKSQKIGVLKRFIEKNDGNVFFKKELKAAKKMLIKHNIQLNG